MMNDELTTLRVERGGSMPSGVLSVILDRPEVHDAFDDVMIVELTRVFTALADDAETRVVLLRSNGKHFSAGADLNWMRRAADQSEEDNRADARQLEAMFRAIATCPKPVVARVQGAALGGGSGLVATADISVASRRAVFGFTEARLGILPAVISPYVLRKIHQGAAQALFLTGSRFDAQRAWQLGLVQELCDPEELETTVRGVIDDLLACSPDAQARIKKLIPTITHLSLPDAAELTVEEITQSRAGGDGKGGMAAFLAKEKPPWLR
jgi:methylglutaconyl-CoA hydratase